MTTDGGWTAMRCHAGRWSMALGLGCATIALPAAPQASAARQAQEELARAGVAAPEAVTRSASRKRASEPVSPPANEYRINAGDDLDVSVWGEDRMQRTVRVLPDGSLAFPLAGTINAAGRTPEQIAADIRSRLAPNYRDAPPSVTVAVREAAGLRFYVTGKVKTPGGYTAGRALDVLQALSLAGGLAEFADIKHAVILRQTASGQVVEPVALKRILKGSRKLRPGALAEPLPVLRSGDVLVIP